MSTKELRDQAHQTIDAIPEDKLERFVAILSEVQQILRDTEFDARLKRILDENRGLIQRLA